MTYSNAVIELMDKAKKYPPKNVCSFLSNRFEFQISFTYFVIRCAHNHLGGVAQWLGRRFLAGGLFLTYA